jgi:hypothetical protein
MAADGPVVLVQAEKFRIVTLPNGTHVVEKHEGCDALGVERWRDLRFGEADSVSRMLREWIIAHAVKDLV